MKKILTLALAFAALLMALCLTACPKKQDPMNTVAYFEHGFSVEQMAILRYEYNAQGKILNILVLDWNTLFPAMKADTNDFDISYRYDSTGKLISHTFHGANMVLEYDENGHVKHSRGYRVGQAYSIDYTCDESGTIRSISLTKDGSSLGTQAATYEYTEAGKLLKEGKFEYSYGDGEIAISNGDTKVAQTYRIKLNASSHIQEISFQKKGDYPDYKTRDVWYKWSYDEAGVCVASEGYSEYLDFEYLTTCSLTYDKKGRLVDALTEVDEACPTMRSYAVSYEYGKDGLVSRANYREVAAPDSKTGSYNNVREYVGGRLAKSMGEHFPTASRPYTIRSTSIYDPATGHYLSGSSEYVDAQGKPVKPEGLFSPLHAYRYDEMGRRIYHRATDYRSGEIEEDTEYFYHYNDQSEIVQTVKKVLKDIYGTTSTETTDYEGGIKTRETIEHFWNKEAHDLKKERRSLNVYDYDTEGRQTHYHLKTYDIDGETEILRGEEETHYDFVKGNGIYERFSNALYDESGKLEQTNLSIEDEEGNYVVTTCDYENGVVRKKTVENNVRQKWIFDKGTAFSRPTDDKVEYFTASGEIEKTEVNEYEYHENNYRSKHTCRLYDADGKLIETIVYEYDEAGQLIEK